MSTVVCSVAVLSESSGSPVVEETVATLLIVPAASGLTVMATDASPSAASKPRSHVTVPPASEQVPVDGVAVSKVLSAGSVSVRVTASASSGPSL